MITENEILKKISFFIPSLDLNQEMAKQVEPLDMPSALEEPQEGKLI